MKKIIRIVCVWMLIVLALPVGVRADVIHIPMDTFYEEHWDACEYHSRRYTAAGPNGEVTAYEGPESDREKAALPNGSVLWVSYTYQDADGIVWGCWEDWEQDLLGWVPMEYLELIYDGVSFDDEYVSEYIFEDGQLDAQYCGQTVYFWEYPGSKDCSWIALDAEQDYLPEFWARYTDTDGRTWGKVGYYMGQRDCWICLDDPTADFKALYPDRTEETEPETVPEPAEEQQVAEIVPKKNTAVKLWAIGAVSVTVAATAVLLYLLKKKKQ